MDGVLVVDKPQGPTSHDVVAVTRRALGVDRAGHTGTLDPLATGVLAIVIGRATRLASFLSGADKEYVARIRFGASTPTYDAESFAGADESGSNREVSLAPAPAEAAVSAALTAFVGTYLQQPPPFSAKKVGGTEAYKLARKGKPAAIAPAVVTVRAIEMLSYRDGVVELRLVCSSGFYVRSLAHDLGQRLACGGFLDGLRRTRAGDFTLDDAVPLESIVDGDPKAVRDRLVPMAQLLQQIPAVTLTGDGVTRASHGNTLSRGDFLESPDPSIGLPETAVRLPPDTAVRLPPNTAVRLMDADGRLIGIGIRRARELLHPSIVLV